MNEKANKETLDILAAIGTNIKKQEQMTVRGINRDRYDGLRYW